MALEGVELNAGTGGATVATDTIGGLDFQVVKLAVGADGTADLVSNSAPIPISDAGGAITVDGTVAVTNAGLTELAAAINGSSQMDVNIAASNATITVASHAVTNAGTFATQVDGAALTALQLIDNIVAVEDAAAGSGYSGVPFLAVRQDSHSDLAADGDFISPTIDSDGGLRVSIVAGAGSGGTAQADDADFTAGTTQGTPIQGVYESSPSSVTDGDLGTVGITQTRALRVHVSSGGVSGIVDDAAFTAGSSEGVLMMGVASADTVDANDAGAIAMTTARAMHVAVQSIAAGNNNIGDVDVASIAAGNNNIGDVDVASIAAGDNNIGNVDIVSLPASTNTLEVVGDVAGDAGVAGNPVLIGLRASTAIPTAMSADNDAVYGWADLNGATVVAGRIVDDAAFTPGTSRVHPIAFQADETATDSVDEGDAGCPRMTLDRKVIVTPYVHAAAGGWTPYKNLDCDESEDEIKGTPGKIGWIHCMNLANAKRYLKLYNDTAANVSVGTTVPVHTFPLPTMADTNGAGFTINFGDAGVQFSAAITVAATTGFADNDTGAPGANEVIFNCGYL